ncbi:uncharacterized protein LOC143373193 [Andrena cerasifolii]|uniref:uncharacterized protein LOC143373193 n=1 Tax=Andrena cerasifolii TaxID=2819439 RepID=UPI0040376A54
MTSESVVVEAGLDSLSDYSLQLNRWFLKPIGAWPPSSSTSRLERIVSIALIVISYCLISFTVVPSLLLILLGDEDNVTKLKLFGPLSHWFVGGINYTTLLLRGKEIRYCVEHVRMDWRIITRAKDQSVMVNNAKFGRDVAGFCAAIMYGGLVSYCVVSRVSTEIVYVGNETRTVHMLPCAVYKKLLNVDTSPMNEIVFVSQFMSGFVVTSTAVAAFGLAAVFAAHACGQLNILVAWVTEYVNASERHNKGAYFSEVGVVVEHHLRVLRFIARIERVMRRICFMELCRCTWDICIIGYDFLTEWSDHDFRTLSTYFVILISMSFNIFIVCYIGEVLTEQCKKIGEEVYMTDWYHLPYKNAHDLIMIIARSSVVTKITAGKIIHMSVYTFGDVSMLINNGNTHLDASY